MGFFTVRELLDHSIRSQKFFLVKVSRVQGRIFKTKSASVNLVQG